MLDSTDVLMYPTNLLDSIHAACHFFFWKKQVWISYDGHGEAVMSLTAI